ncbi:phosphomethylpyrimidine synthase [Lachnospiraceae bacterium PF1-21]|uniref:Phosphomethylpyrimidine synthase n=1 Tax=Ohessyouella blattaphilus TaxID=2949333 RepID=A0ABT1EKK5_9FIRM|nr:phosphomethylpyrimidine synthase ThiC [Ohessyouella blattaphilus]MCP1111235.1 phosphomethylpyrimidine synthase ThiC [Ohessyouella blattaphilus]MCR8564629.1 phosphomethylpyrimidine synthase ThiC [Ohessyouella blattaphilus]
MNYHTQMEAARKGIITKELAAVAKEENLVPEELRQLVAKGEVAIPCNVNHVALKPKGIGKALKTKINVNLGTSKDLVSLDSEVAKVKAAEEMGADAIMDLSTYGDTQSFRKRLSQECGAVLGTVPIYDALVYYNKALKDITAKEWLAVAEMHGQDGIDFLTIHAGLNRANAEKFKARRGRLTNVVSRGGSLMFAWMEMTGEENPFYEYFDELLEICRRYDITLSLGDALRPGSLHDATDGMQIEELITLGDLTKRAWEKDVQVIIEGPGHMPMDQIEANMKIQESLCHGAPFYVLGPLVTDVAPGYDHITAAIGGALAAWKGASFLCYVTPAEHLRLPDVDDVKEGIVASKIAAHAADLAKGLQGARSWDDAMSKARQEVNWEQMFALALDPVKARSYHESAPPEVENTCSMCGNMCAMKNMNDILNGKEVWIGGENR